MSIDSALREVARGSAASVDAAAAAATVVVAETNAEEAPAA
jgi:hypothetical protein